MSWSSERPVLAVVRYSIITAAAALVLVAGVGLVRVSADNALRGRATAETVGRLAEGFRPTDEKTVVAYHDEEEDEQLLLVTVDEPSKWRASQEIRLRYEPGEGKDPNLGPYAVIPDPTNVVILEPGIRNADQLTGWDFWWPTAVIGGLVLLVLLAWTLRWRLNRSAAAADPTPMRVVVIRGRNQVQMGSTGSVAELLLFPPELPFDADALVQPVPRSLPGVRWQRVHWDPALEVVEPGRTVSVRATKGILGRAVVEPEPGVRLWPASRLRRKGGFGMLFVVQPHRDRARYAQPVKPPPAIWLVPLVAGVFGALRGHFLADAPVFVVGLLVLVTFAWAWTGPAPDEL
ncbi:hypothetical protein [Umezawaea sp. NPDC059074]|uniref:hypothetical protein n=1 Tax=Umezawaea sp. NPDC059074 TaxID=3346716 RepID=UPI0036B4E853